MTSVHFPAVSRCVRALQSASDDTQKLSALFVVPKTVRAKKCTKEDRAKIIEVRNDMQSK